MTGVQLHFCAYTCSTAGATCLCSIIITIIIILIVTIAGASAIFGKYLPGMVLGVQLVTLIQQPSATCSRLSLLPERLPNS